MATVINPRPGACRSISDACLTAPQPSQGDQVEEHVPVTAFGERLDRHGGKPDFVAVLACANEHPIGYAYGNTIKHGNRYWQRTSPGVPMTPSSPHATSRTSRSWSTPPLEKEK